MGSVHVGLIVGIGPAATDFYYRYLIAEMARRQVGLELTMAHADTPILLRNQMAGDAAAQVAIYMRLTERLRAAGAGCVAVTSISGHFCIDAFAAVSPLPVIDMLGTVDAAIGRLGYRKVGVLGTRLVMDTGFYGAVRGAEVMAPEGADRAAVHEAYIAMAGAGRANAAQREVMFRVGRGMVAAGAEAVMLGGTDLVLVFDGSDDCGFATVDCAAVHAGAIAAVAAG